MEALADAVVLADQRRQGGVLGWLGAAPERDFYGALKVVDVAHLARDVQQPHHEPDARATCTSERARVSGGRSVTGDWEICPQLNKTRGRRT